jgi:hypothetical protein
LTSLKRWLTPEELREFKTWKRQGTKRVSAYAVHRSKRGKKRKERKCYKQLRRECEIRCHRYLKKFWPEFNLYPEKESRIRLLKAAANPAWQRVPDKLRLSLRSEYERKKWKLLNMPPSECACCSEEGVKERHHIIPLAFGGINDELNLIGIGIKCHTEIHPWMK